MALCLLLKDWAGMRDVSVIALTVDHGLRLESAGEAAKVGALLQARGIDHIILRWDGDKPQTHIQEKARAARYALMADYCAAQGIGCLFVAHHAQDQAETFWMRLAHGSGLAGLGGMTAKSEIYGVHLIRPLLSFDRQDLRDYCRAKGVMWIEDSSNVNDKYLRPRLRAFEDVLAEEGLTPQRLSDVMRKLHHAEEVLQFYTQQTLQQAAVFHDEGYVSLVREKLQGLPLDIGRRVLETVLQRQTPGDYGPGYAQVLSIAHNMMAADFSGVTIHGCEIFFHDDKIIICREEAAVSARIPVQDNMIWDGRFQISGFKGLEVGALRDHGLALLADKISNDRALEKKIRTLPFKVRKTLPVFWDGAEIVAVPHLGLGRDVGRISPVSAFA